MKYRLGDLITDIAAGPFGSNLRIQSFVSFGFPIIDGANLKGFKVTDNITKFVTEEKARSLHRSIAKRGDIVVTISGTLGQIAYIPNDSRFVEYLCSQRQFRATFDQSRVDVGYLVYYFHTREGQHKILSFASQVGVPALAQPLKNFRKIEIDLPDIHTQKKIVKILDSIEQKISINAKINGCLMEQVFAAYDNLVGEDTCVEATLSDAGQVVGGGTPSKAKPEYYSEHGISWITPKDLSLDRSVFIERGSEDISELGLAKSGATLMPPGTVLFSSRAPIGYTAISLGAVSTNQGFKSIIPKLTVGPYFVFCFLKKNLEMIESMASGSTFKEVSGGIMKKVPILLPEEKALARFNRFAKPIFKQIKINEATSKRLAKVRDEMLPRLMSGEIDVSDVEV